MTLIKKVNGEEVILTVQEEAETRSRWESNRIKDDVRKAEDASFKTKRNTDITALGDRASLMAEVDAMTSIPDIKAVVKKLAEIIYTEVNKTVS